MSLWVESCPCVQRVCRTWRSSSRTSSLSYRWMGAPALHRPPGSGYSYHDCPEGLNVRVRWLVYMSPPQLVQPPPLAPNLFPVVQGSSLHSSPAGICSWPLCGIQGMRVAATGCNLGREDQTSKQKTQHQPGMVVHTYNPSIWEAKTGGAQVPGQPGLCSEALSQNQTPKSKDLCFINTHTHIF
jgi:hypothetical protein